MPPDMTAGLMPLIGTPPSVTVSGKTATGPPGQDASASISLTDSLFASLLAQNIVPLKAASAKASVLKTDISEADISQDATPNTISAPPISAKPNLAQKPISTQKAVSRDPFVIQQAASPADLQVQNALPVLTLQLGTLEEPTADHTGNTPPLAVLPNGKPAVAAKIASDSKEDSDPKQAIALKKLTAAKPAISESLKTMDTTLELSSLPTEKAKDKASELPLHKASADTPNAVSQNSVQMPVVPGPVPAAANTLMPLLAPITMLVPATFTATAASTTPIVASAVPTRQAVSAIQIGQTVSANPVVSDIPVMNVAAAALPIPTVPTLRETLNSSQVVGLALPRTFTLTGSVVSGPAPGPKISLAAPTVTLAAASTVPTSGSQAALNVPISDAAAILTQSAAIPGAISTAPTLDAVMPKLASTQTAPNPPANISLPHFEANISAVPRALNTVPTVSQALVSAAPQTPVIAAAIQTAQPVLTAAQTTPAAAVAAIDSQPLAFVVGPNPASPTSTAGKINSKSLETTLKSPDINADINTRLPAVALPSNPAKMSVSSADFEAVSSKSEKHDDAQADPVTLGTNTLTGTQASASIASPSPLESKPLTAAEQADVVNQTANGVAAMPLPTKPGGVEQMSLQLHPKDWGHLQVSVSIVPGTETGSAKTVTAHIVAETPQIKAALESQTGTLHQALTASGLHLEHLTVSVKAPEAKALEVKPTAQSASAGQSSSQGQPNTNGQAGSSMGGGQTSANQTSSTSAGNAGSGAFASFAGGSQDGRQGQQQRAFSAAFEPEQEEMTRGYTPLRPASGRIDTHA